MWPARAALLIRGQAVSTFLRRSLQTPPFFDSFLRRF